MVGVLSMSELGVGRGGFPLGEEIGLLGSYAWGRVGPEKVVIVKVVASSFSRGCYIEGGSLLLPHPVQPGPLAGSSRLGGCRIGLLHLNILFFVTCLRHLQLGLYFSLGVCLGRDHLAQVSLHRDMV